MVARRATGARRLAPLKAETCRMQSEGKGQTGALHRLRNETQKFRAKRVRERKAMAYLAAGRKLHGRRQGDGCGGDEGHC